MKNHMTKKLKQYPTSTFTHPQRMREEDSKAFQNEVAESIKPSKRRRPRNAAAGIRTRVPSLEGWGPNH